MRKSCAFGSRNAGIAEELVRWKYAAFSGGEQARRENKILDG